MCVSPHAGAPCRRQIKTSTTRPNFGTIRLLVGSQRQGNLVVSTTPRTDFMQPADLLLKRTEHGYFNLSTKAAHHSQLPRILPPKLNVCKPTGARVKFWRGSFTHARK